EGVLRDRELEPHDQQLEDGDEEEAEGGDDHHQTDVLVVGRGHDLDPARAALGEAVDDQLRGLAGAHDSFFSSATTLSWADWMSLLVFLMNASYSSGETTSTSVRIGA